MVATVIVMIKIAVLPYPAKNGTQMYRKSSLSLSSYFGRAIVFPPSPFLLDLLGLLFYSFFLLRRPMNKALSLSSLIMKVVRKRKRHKKLHE